ncbi:MAG: ribosome maturation factor RimM, partial [Spirulinaceae cyanobacterium]
MKQEWLEIGKIVAPQGLKGEMRVLSTSDFPERFEEPGKRWLRDLQGNPPQKVELIKGRFLPGKKLYVIQLAEVQGRDRAEALRGYKLLVTKDSLPDLAEDEYHVRDLVDLEVYNQKSSQVIGKVVDIFSAGNDLLEVKLKEETKALDKKAAPSVP